jgi:hypothetical protein
LEKLTIKKSKFSKIIAGLLLIILSLTLASAAIISNRDNSSPSPTPTLTTTPSPTPTLTPTPSPTPTLTPTPSPTPTLTPTPSPTPTLTPTPTPTPERPVGNLLAIPDSFYETQYWSYISIDTEVYRSYPSSIRLDADYERGTRECISYWINVFPGDHIYFGAWCKTSNDVTNTVYTGGRIGIDFYAGEWDDVHVVDGLPHDYTVIDGVWCSGDGDAQMSSFGHPPVSQFLDLHFLRHSCARHVLHDKCFWRTGQWNNKRHNPLV